MVQVKTDYLRIGAFTIPRERARLLVPRLANFEKSLPAVLELQRHMDTHQGAIPPWFQELKPGERDNITRVMGQLERLEQFCLKNELKEKRP